MAAGILRLGRIPYDNRGIRRDIYGSADDNGIFEGIERE